MSILRIPTRLHNTVYITQWFITWHDFKIIKLSVVKGVCVAGSLGDNGETTIYKYNQIFRVYCYLGIA